MPVDKILALGAEDYEGGDTDVFNMAVMGFRLAGRANGVSKLHGHVSREMFAGLWPGFDETDVPITLDHQRRARSDLGRPRGLRARRARGGAPRPRRTRSDWSAVDKVPSQAIWETKRELRSTLVDDVRERVRKSWLQRGAAPAELGWVDAVLDPDVLDDRLRPPRADVQAAHPDAARSRAAQAAAARPGAADPARDRRQVAPGRRDRQEADPGDGAASPTTRRCGTGSSFLPNYDIAMAQPLYPGCDVWLNNPLRPYEACGTSGMKAALNGGLNLSILDGWWDEWFDGDNGWAIPSADGVDDADRRDDIEAEALYDLIENEVAPRFYDVDGEKLPARWIEMVRHTLKSLGPKVLASRMVRDYVHQLYTPAAVGARRVDGRRRRPAAELAAWKARVREAWPQVRIEHVESSGVSDAPALGSGADRAGLRVAGRARPERRRRAGRARPGGR